MTAVSSPTAESALRAAILAAPDDDAPRLIYADWLDEQDQGEYAEFIRDTIWMSRTHTDCPVRLADLTAGRPVPLRCGRCGYCRARQRAERYYARHSWLADRPYGVLLDPTPLDDYIPCDPGGLLVVRRGFVEEVRLSVAEFLGGRCEQCVGTGVQTCERCAGEGCHVYVIEPVGSCTAGAPCPICGGSGRTPGLAAQLFAAQPITNVTLTDREPWLYMADQDKWSWWPYHSTAGYPNGPSNLPAAIFDLLWEIDESSHRGDRVGTYDCRLAYPTRGAALDAFSRACVAHGRRLAGREK